MLERNESGRSISIVLAITPEHIGDEKVNAVNARDLHEFLLSRQDFSTWVKNRISQYGFAENVDFICFHKKMEANNATVIEYYLTLDMAKELAMVERNARGKQARQYFIDCERRAKAMAVPAGLPDFTNPIIAARAWADEKERGDLNELALREVQQKLTVAEPKLQALEKIAGSDGLMCVTNAAKALQIGPKALFQWLSGNQWIYRRVGSSGWVAYQQRIQSGFLEHKVTTVERSDGSQKVVEQVLVTPKGLTRLAELLTNLRESGTASE